VPWLLLHSSVPETWGTNRGDQRKMILFFESAAGSFNI
jgi:hypothetical protein